MDTEHEHDIEWLQEHMLNLSMNNIEDIPVQNEPTFTKSLSSSKSTNEEVSILDRLCKICKTYDKGYLGSEVCKECYWKSSKEYSHSENPIEHPAHYGGDTIYEHIKVVEAWGLGYNLGNATKYICRVSKKKGSNTIDDLKKALWYIQHEIGRLSK